MTDLLSTSSGQPVDNVIDPAGGGGVEGRSPTGPAPDETGRQCERVTDGVQCTNHLPADAQATRKYCDDHKARGSKSKVNPDGSGERTPTSVTVNVAAPKVPKDLKDLEAAAAAYLGLIPLVLAMTGDEVCPSAIERSIPAVAAQLAVLTKYHPGLKKFLTPGESTGEMIAWFGLLVAASPVIITGLVHHHLISESMAERVAGFVAVGVAGAASGDG